MAQVKLRYSAVLTITLVKSNAFFTLNLRNNGLETIRVSLAFCGEGASLPLPVVHGSVSL